ncbi:MAG: ABC transporter ATP-binding protein [Flavobacteriales bacterium]
MKSLQYLNKYFLKYKWRLLFGVIFTIISNYFGVQMPIYFKEAIDSFQKNIQLAKANDFLFLAIKLGGFYMLLSLAKGFFLFLMRQTIIVMSRNIEYDLKNEIYSHYQTLDQGFFKRNATGDLMNRISEDVGLVRMYLGPGIMYIFNLIIAFTMIVTQMMNISPSLTLFVLIPLPIMSVLIYRVSSRMNAMSMLVQKEQSILSTIAQETFSGIRIIKAYNREKETEEKLSQSAEAYKDQSMRLVLVNALFIPTIMFLIGISVLIAVYYGGLLTFSKDINSRISVGSIVAFIMFVNNLTWPFASLGWVSSIIQRAEASQKRINEFLLTKSNIINKVDSIFSFEGSIEFKNVHFEYPVTNIQAVSNLSFKVNKGETLAIVGQTGSGKSTISSLLMRQYDLESGAIFIDGNEIKSINLDSFRAQTGIVPQEVFLFSDTIRENLQFGVTDHVPSDKELIEVCELTHVYHNIKEFPDQFDTLLGERGVNLSGGQKQRISIARALLKKPKLLILDDCLSAVDTETEEIILRNLEKGKDERTTIVISHRISTIRNATKIIVINEGKMIESGTHDELISLKGVYFDMHEQQLRLENQH